MTKTEQNMIGFIDGLVMYIDDEDSDYADWIEAEALRIVKEGDYYVAGEGYTPNE